MFMKNKLNKRKVNQLIRRNPIKTLNFLVFCFYFSFLFHFLNCVNFLVSVIINMLFTWIHDDVPYDDFHNSVRFVRYSSFVSKD